MRINRGFLGWGVFLLLVGAVPLAVRAGYLTELQIRDVGRLWPLILIGIGLGILLARSRLAVLGGILVAGTFGLIVGGLLSGGVGGFNGGACGPDSATTAFASREGSLGGASGSVRLDLNCGDLDVAVAPGSDWRVEGRDGDGRGPDLSADGRALSVRSRDTDRGPLGVLGAREAWRITLPDAVRLDLKVELNAGSSTMDLAGAALGDVELKLNAGSATLDLAAVRELGGLRVGLNAGSLNLTLPNQSVSGAIEANAGTVNLCVPPDAALRLRTAESIVASYDYEGHGLVKEGSTWQTPGFDSAAVRIDLGTQANAGSFTLDPEGGCGG